MADQRSIQDVLEAKNTRLRQLEAEYLRTKTYLDSVEWQKKRDMVLMRLSAKLATYSKGQDQTAAVFVLAQAKQILEEIQEVSDVIVEYEGLKREIENYHRAR